DGGQYTSGPPRSATGSVGRAWIGPKLVEDRAVRIDQLDGVEQVRASLERAAQCLATTPAFDLAMVPGSQDRGNGELAELLRSGVLRVLQQPGGERVAFVRRRLDGAGEETDHRVDQHQGGQLA